MLKLTQNIELSGGCDSISIQDTSGVYHATNNPDGWGAPNSATGDATLVEIRMQKYLGNDTWDTEFSIDASGTLPNTADTVFTFTSAEIEDAAGNNYGDKFPDGVYRVRYFIECGATLTYVAEDYLTVKCTVDCCYNEALSRVVNEDCDKSLEKKFNQIKLQIDLLNSSIECGDIDAILDYIDYINKLCSECGCRCS